MASACATCAARRNAPAAAGPIDAPTSSSGICLLDRPSVALALVLSANSPRRILRNQRAPAAAPASSSAKSPLRQTTIQ
ncbi:hypothetical protein QP185_04395 [Sphingomonas aerolata]|uniref:hypothetical protein n=1 Tax=Sphingomonas aerolata TaxID=185951 RepID=UPI002FE10E64